MRNIAGREHYPFRFTRSSRGVNDRDDVGVVMWRGPALSEVERGPRPRNVGSFPTLRPEDLFKQNLRRSFRPVLNNSVTQPRISAANQRRRTVLHHGDEFARCLAGVERYYDQTLGHDGQVHRDPAYAVAGEQCATIAFM